MIDGHKNLENDVETGIFQRLLVFLILFLIYISRVFKQVEKELSEMVSLLFINDLNFIASKMSTKGIAKSLKKVNNSIIE